MNRIEQRFAALKTAGRKGLVVYIGAGDPDLDATRRLALEFDRSGVDILELGIPFSDPLADGLVNQLAAQRGLSSGTTPPKVLEAIRQIRTDSQVPIVLYVYYNLIHRVGLDAFVERCAASGVDGLLVLDLPPEEADAYERKMRESGLCAIWLVAPTTPDDRIAAIVRRGSGFIYYVSREGVTGMQSKVSDSIAAMVAKIRARTTLPIAIGFGVSNTEQARLVASSADAVVVGSAVVDRIGREGNSPSLAENVGGFVQTLAEAVHAVV